MSVDVRPRVVVLGGPNGAGKSTAAPRLLKGALGVTEFVNADTIAQGLSGFAPERAAIAAGRIMLSRLKELAARRENFAFETTMASRTFLPWLKSLVISGYSVHVIFLWLPSAKAAVARVAERVRQGGHSVPEATIRRRYVSGLANFLNAYRGLAKSWQVFDNSRRGKPRLIAMGTGWTTIETRDARTWRQLAGASA
jgi:predicted ABC-type ATPase